MPCLCRVACGHKRLVAEHIQRRSLIRETIVIAVLVAVDVYRAVVFSGRPVIVGRDIDQRAVRVEMHLSAESVYLFYRRLQSILTAEQRVRLVNGIAVVKSSLPPSEYHERVDSVLKPSPVKSGKVGIPEIYLPELMLEYESLPAGHIVDPRRAGVRDIPARVGKRPVIRRAIPPVAVKQREHALSQIPRPSPPSPRSGNATP